MKYKNKLIPLNLDEINFIVIHHASSETATPEQIHEWHLKKGWVGAGYNEYIRKDGSLYIMRGDHEGAHTKGYNQNSYGICLEGDFEIEKPTEKQLLALIKTLKYHKSRFKNLRSILKHKDLNDTECPGKNIQMSYIISKVYEQKETWEDIIKKASDDPNRWIRGIKMIKNMDGNLGDLEIFKYTPDLVLKIKNII